MYKVYISFSSIKVRNNLIHQETKYEILRVLCTSLLFICGIKHHFLSSTIERETSCFSRPYVILHWNSLAAPSCSCKISMTLGYDTRYMCIYHVYISHNPNRPTIKTALYNSYGLWIKNPLTHDQPFEAYYNKIILTDDNTLRTYQTIEGMGATIFFPQ